MLDEMKKRVYEMNVELPRQGLVAMTSGNVSGRRPGDDRVVIKPSGMPYEEMGPEDMVVVDLQGEVLEGDKKPSSDTASHLYVYRQRQDVNGMVHTHSNYATSFAALGEPIPACLTQIADEFGGDIPVGPFVPIGEEDIGQAIVENIGDSPGILLKNHGVFTVGESPEAALKSAVMVEDAARTVHLAQTRGEPDRLPDEAIERAHRRYQEDYGQ
ncbi:L-ribulose-5-phosphate 4-epimerase [Halarsenatibacter silvermanii]|uniref:L-ribulose-5-phosphate 4-epimerase n=1 Tax=Halarsenatibacter silvermanii TaxID=321763 RepID=A0A1G9LZS3_9FIRM|nr:L-ribulose-5-phosphate 4-epimerase [Halarsenatibacter silvermanii]SDL67383.1 L-ribulose 5-phosphate 4-epimerase [Halarsenatibacter silvermanii]